MSPIIRIHKLQSISSLIHWLYMIRKWCDPRLMNGSRCCCYNHAIHALYHPSWLIDHRWCNLQIVIRACMDCSDSITGDRYVMIMPIHVHRWSRPCDITVIISPVVYGSYNPRVVYRLLQCMDGITHGSHCLVHASHDIHYMVSISSITLLDRNIHGVTGTLIPSAPPLCIVE